jgi:phasin
MWLGSGPQLLVTASFKKGRESMNDANVKAKMNNPQLNAKAGADEKPGFDVPLFAVPVIFRGIAEQSVVRASGNYERIKAVSGEIADILRETYSTNANGAADYGVKVIEISSVNTNSAFDFLTNLMDTKSLAEIITISAMQSRKNLEAMSAQNRELWELGKRIAAATAQPLKESFTRVLQKAS